MRWVLRPGMVVITAPPLAANRSSQASCQRVEESLLQTHMPQSCADAARSRAKKFAMLPLGRTCPTPRAGDNRSSASSSLRVLHVFRLQDDAADEVANIGGRMRG